jgi:hypothetical protein
MLRLSTPPSTVALYSRERRNEGHRVVVQSESRGRENSLGDERRVRHRLESDEKIEILHWTINCGGWDILVATARRANDERERALAHDTSTSDITIRAGRLRISYQV